VRDPGEAAAEIMRTKQLSDRIAFAYASAAELLADLRRNAEEHKEDVASTVKDAPRLMRTFGMEPSAPTGIWVDPLAPRFKEAKAGWGFLREIMKAEKPRNRS
jgi:hypothetical protein